MEKGKPSNGLRSKIKYITSRRTKVLLAASPPPPPEHKTKSQLIADKDDVDLSGVPLPDILQRFNSLDKSSAQFPDQLIDLLSGEEYKSCITRLQDEDVDYLDDVCVYCASSTLC